MFHKFTIYFIIGQMYYKRRPVVISLYMRHKLTPFIGFILVRYTYIIEYCIITL